MVNHGHTKSSKWERGDLYNGYQEGCEEEGREEEEEVINKTKIVDVIKAMPRCETGHSFF